jgi:hypothetical protein
MANKFLAVASVLLGLSACGSVPQADMSRNPDTVLYRSAWRDGLDPRLSVQAPEPDSISTVAIPEFDASFLKISMRRSEDFSRVANGTPRAEVVFGAVAHFALGKEYEVRWSTMTPPNYKLDSLQPEIITQVHQSSNTGSPPFSLMLGGGHYQVEVRGGEHAVRSFSFGTPVSDEGKVVNWVLRYRPDDKGAGAITDLFKDGVRVVNAIGLPNSYPDEKSAYLKIGVYKWWWITRPSDVSERTMYYGDVEIIEKPVTLK